MEMTLKEMREAKGYTSHEAAARIAAFLGLSKYHFSNVLKAEVQGIEKIRVLRAYAAVYGRSLEEVEEAARRPVAAAEI